MIAWAAYSNPNGGDAAAIPPSALAGAANLRPDSFMDLAGDNQPPCVHACVLCSRLAGWPGWTGCCLLSPLLLVMSCHVLSCLADAASRASTPSLWRLSWGMAATGEASKPQLCSACLLPHAFCLPTLVSASGTFALPPSRGTLRVALVCYACGARTTSALPSRLSASATTPMRSRCCASCKVLQTQTGD